MRDTYPYDESGRTGPRRRPLPRPPPGRTRRARWDRATPANRAQVLQAPHAGSRIVSRRGKTRGLVPRAPRLRRIVSDQFVSDRIASSPFICGFTQPLTLLDHPGVQVGTADPAHRDNSPVAVAIALSALDRPAADALAKRPGGGYATSPGLAANAAPLLQLRYVDDGSRIRSVQIRRVSPSVTDHG